LNRLHDWHVCGESVTVKPHTFKVELNRVAHVVLDFFYALTGRDAAVKPHDVRTEVGASILDHYGVLGHRDFLSNLACLTMLARVILATSSPSAPGTVTQPSFVG
jgi:hypothetical protein